MVLKLKLLMDKQRFNKGYTFIECLLVLFIISILTTITSIKIKYSFNESVDDLIDGIVIKQFSAIMENDYQYYEENDMDIRFNRLGNVNHADSYEYDYTTIIVSLGTGRVYEEDE